jgi:hypothetical protein
MLISEMHFTERSYLNLPKYTVCHTNHPAGTAHGGTAIIIKTTIKHHLQSSYKQDVVQAVSAVYLPPKHAIKLEQLEEF